MTKFFDRNKPTLFFDFDGTLADTIQINFKIFNQLAFVYRYQPINEQQMRNFRECHALEILRAMQIGPLRKTLLVVHARHRMKRHIHTIQPFPNLFKTLNAFKNHFNFAVISTNSKKKTSTLF